MNRPRPSPRPAAFLAALAVLSVAVPPCALARKAPHDDGEALKAPGRNGKAHAGLKHAPAEAPPPDPLAGAWPSKEAPQLGNGTFRSELLVAARRMVGMSGSFDPDGFVKHLAYVLDLAYKRDLPDDAWVRTVVRRASKRGLLKSDAKARPGDVVLFSLDPARPGSANASHLLAGVAESSAKGVVRFIAPVGETVSRGVARPGRKPDANDTAIRECRAPEPPQGAAAPKGKDRKKGKGKKAHAPRPLPCRAGQMWIGRIPAESLPALF